MTTARPAVEKLHQSNTFIVVRFAHEDGPRPEVRLECRPPGQAEWVRLDRLIGDQLRPETRRAVAQKVFVFTASAEPAGGGDSFALIYDPQPGDWEFRVYLVGFPLDRPPAPVRFRLEAEGEGVEIRKPVELAKPVWPGAYTSVFRVLISDTTAK